MKKQRKKEYLKIKLFNIRLRKNFKNLKYSRGCAAFIKNNIYTRIAMPKRITVTDRNFRQDLLNVINNLNVNPKGRYKLIFTDVELLVPDGTIHLIHQFDKLKELQLKGSPSYNEVVNSMLTKLGVYKRAKVRNYNTKHTMVDGWYIFDGKGINFEEEFADVQTYLSENIRNLDDEFIINTAISEAVSNVVDHGYDKTDVYRKWLLFTGIFENKCHIVVSDLGKTIPKTAPRGLRDKLKETLEFWKTKTDADRIEVATTWRKTATEKSYRGKGFDNIVDVNNIREGARISVISRKGAWTSTSKKSTKTIFHEPLNGTIVYWVIPLAENNQSLTEKAA